MTDRPTIFSAPMVRALLDGRKTQTRRVLKPQPVWDNGAIGIEDDAGRWAYCSNTERGFGEGLPRSRFKLPYAIGDRLWVREAHAFDSVMVRYYATDDVHELRKKRSPIHMPRWASRLTLTVTDVRVQRLQEISEADAQAEGFPISWDGKPYDPPSPQEDIWQGYGRASMSLYWTSLHGPDAWAANPWVAAISFTVARRTIDAGGDA